jgi:chemotaxis protein MotB
MAGKGGGGAWKVAYADFVTAMMAFFLVMWITAQSAEVKEAVAEHFSTPLFGWTEARSTNTPQMVNDLQRKAIATSRPPEKVADNVRAKKRRFEDISTSVLFADDSSELDAGAKKTLDRLVPHLAGKLQRIEIRGHHARQPAGEKERTPWDICYARCRATLAYLEEKGISPDRIRISLAGDNEPRTDQANLLPEHNSRVEVLLLSEFVRPSGAKSQDAAAEAAP